MRRNQWLASVGITGWNGSESPAGLRRNTQLEQAQSDNGAQTAALQRDQANLQAAKARTAVLQTQLQQADAIIARQQA